MKTFFSSLLLTCVFHLFFTISLCAWEGSGTEENPYKISSREDLENLSLDVNSGNNFAGEYFKLNNDIDMSAGFVAGVDTNFTPIGNGKDSPFKGYLDGDGKVISNLKVDIKTASSNVYVGLFGKVDSGILTKIRLENVMINVDTVKHNVFAGGLVGDMKGIISHAYVAGEIVAYSSYSSRSANAGGLVGNMDGVISYCCATANVVSSGYAGGLIGCMDKTICKSYATGNVISFLSNAGGLAGFITGSITDCYATGDVSTFAKGSAGGLVGDAGYGEFKNCYAMGDVLAPKYFAGGLVGHMSGVLNNCYATGKILEAEVGGGLIGKRLGSKVENCYWNITNNVSILGVGMGTSDSVIGKTTPKMMDSIFVGILNDSTPFAWGKKAGVNNNYPALEWQVVTNCVSIINGTANVGSTNKAPEGAPITITANPAEEGYEFSKWLSEPMVAFARDTAMQTTFVMPAEAVKITAVYRPLLLTVVGGTLANGEVSGKFIASTRVKVIANAVKDSEFASWSTELGKAKITDTNLQITTIIMGTTSDTIIASFRNTAEIEYQKVHLISKNGTTSPYKPGGSDIILIQSQPADSEIILKCSGLIYGVDFIIAGYAPEGNNFRMTINQLRQGVSINFLNAGANKTRKLKVSLTLPKGWKIDGEKQLIYIIEAQAGEVVGCIVETKNPIIITDSAKNIEIVSTRIVNEDRFGRSGAYSPSTGVFYPNDNQMGLGWLDEMMDANGNGVRMYQGLNIVPKGIIKINPDSIPEMGNNPFVKKPAFKTIIIDPFGKVGSKPKKNAVAINKEKNELTVNPRVKLFSSKGIDESRKNGKMFGDYNDQYVEQLGAQLVMTYKDKTEGIMVQDAPVGAVIISAPASLKCAPPFITSNGKDSVFRLSGDFLGASPKAFYEYKDKNGNVKIISCKVKLYKKAGTDQGGNVIESQLENNVFKSMDIKIPTLSKGADSSSAKLIIGNGVAYGEVKNAAKPKVK